MFFNFQNFFAIFVEFFIIGRVGIDRNEKFFFFSFLTFPNLLWLEEKPQWCFIIFCTFLLFFFCNFLFWVEQDLILTIIFIFSISRPFPTCFGLKRSHNGVFQIFKFFLLFIFEFSNTGQVGIDWNDIFYFLSFSALPNLFWLEEMP